MWIPVSNNIAPPYYAVIFTSIKHQVDEDYYQTFEELYALGSEIEGYLGWEDAKGEEVSISISYWKNMDAINEWKNNLSHQTAKRKAVAEWYKYYRMRICKVELDHQYQRNED